MFFLGKRLLLSETNLHLPSGQGRGMSKRANRQTRWLLRERRRHVSDHSSLPSLDPTRIRFPYQKTTQIRPSLQSVPSTNVLGSPFAKGGIADTVCLVHFVLHYIALLLPKNAPFAIRCGRLLAAALGTRFARETTPCTTEHLCAGKACRPRPPAQTTLAQPTTRHNRKPLLGRRPSHRRPRVLGQPS